MKDKNTPGQANRQRVAAWTFFGPICPLIVLAVSPRESIWGIKALIALGLLCSINGIWLSLDAARPEATREDASRKTWVWIAFLLITGSLGILIGLYLPFYVGETPETLGICDISAYALSCLHLISFSWHGWRRRGMGIALAVLLAGAEFALIAIGADNRVFALCALFACVFGFWAVLFIPFWKRLRAS